MNTDLVPRKSERKEEYIRSDSMREIVLPPPEPVRTYARELQVALAAEDKKEVESACNAIAALVAEAFKVPVPPVKVLSVRPRRETKNTIYETYGDYEFESSRIRLWMRTAVRKSPTSYGTLLSTLCHELCHHLDVVSLQLPNTFHTRGFYERAGLLYHHIQATPVRRLVWSEQANGTYRIDWARTMAGERSGKAVLAQEQPEAGVVGAMHRPGGKALR